MRLALCVVVGLLALAPPVCAQGVVGEVASLVGRAVATRPGEPQRRLHCDDPIFAGDRVTTSGGASVGVLMEGLYAQVQSNSSLGFGEVGDTPELALESGRARVLDTRSGGAPARLTLGGAEARIRGNDTQAYVLSEKAGPYAMVCEYDAPLVLQQGGERAEVGPGECGVANPREGVRVETTKKPRMALTDPDSCRAPLVAAGPAYLHLDPAEATLPTVGAGPDAAWPDPASALPPRDPCDVPGSGCSAPPRPVPVVDPPPVLGLCVPGVACP